MTAGEFLLAVIDASGGSVQGRTLLQKTAFFVAELAQLDVKLGFDAHFYGPYSPTVESMATKLRNLGFIEESGTGFGIVSGGFEVKRYDYALTDDGRILLQQIRKMPEHEGIVGAIRAIRDAGDPNYVELSIAAKAYFLLKQKSGTMSLAQIQREAEKYNWNISPQSIDKAANFLKKVGLATEA